VTAVAAGEFIVYNMQTMAPPPEHLALFEAGLDMETPVLRDHLSHVIMPMAPSAFRKRVWVHLHPQPDPCRLSCRCDAGAIPVGQPRPSAGTSSISMIIRSRSEAPRA